MLTILSALQDIAASKHNTAGCTRDADCPFHKPNCDTTDGTCYTCIEGKFAIKMDGASALMGNLMI